jgi:phosphoribosylanthranilate isomerase
MVKICGLRSPAAALASVAAGADLLGFNFAPVSKRRVDEATARRAIDECRANARSAPVMAGIFVNQPIDEVVQTARRCQLDDVQLSGEEDPAYCRRLAEVGGVATIKALRLSRAEDAGRFGEYTGDGGVALLLADAAVAGSWGGAGTTWDWAAAASVAARFPLLLAGGLTAENVAGAVAAVKPWGVDVASGVETNGQTDPEKVRAFVRRAKGDGP